MTERGVRRPVERPVWVTPAPSVAATEAILVLATAVEVHDGGTQGHSDRVRTLTDLIARQLRFGDADLERLRWAALLHDVGKITISAKILNKVELPTPQEWAEVERHPEEGARLCVALRPWLGAWASVVEQHHERWDGAGYPLGLAGEGISLGARIVAVADAYETMTSGRPYQPPRTALSARTELERCAGTQFDPEIVRAFLELSPEQVGPSGPAAGSVITLGGQRHGARPETSSIAR